MNKKLSIILLIIITAVVAASTSSYFTRKKYKAIALEKHAKARHPLIATAINTFGIKPTGIIHVGSHIGDEKKEYEALGFENRLWIEADPDTYKRIDKKLGRKRPSFQKRDSCLYLLSTLSISFS
jgi:hypothetical protein